MVPDYPRAYIAHLELRAGKAEHRAGEQRQLVARLESRGIDATEARALLVALEHHVAELQAELRMARRLAGGTN